MADFLHQLGWRYQWNVESILKEGTGDGAIVALRYMGPKEIFSLTVGLRRRSFLDPQFFLPNSQRGKLPQFEFFPQVIADGFSTSEYDENTARASAELCLQFQIENGFRYCVIPTRYRGGSPSDFIPAQRQLFGKTLPRFCGQGVKLHSAVDGRAAHRLPG